MIYLAAPFFTEHEKERCLGLLQYLREQGNEVYAPMEHTVENAWGLSNADWAKAVFDEDIRALDMADEVWALNFGLNSDTGTAWECGYAYAKGKIIYQLLCDGKDEYSLMMFNGSDFVFSDCDKKINQK